jgi:hypothetical protein
MTEQKEFFPTPEKKKRPPRPPNDTFRLKQFIERELKRHEIVKPILTAKDNDIAMRQCKLSLEKWREWKGANPNWHEVKLGNLLTWALAESRFQYHFEWRRITCLLPNMIRDYDEEVLKPARDKAAEDREIARLKQIAAEKRAAAAKRKSCNSDQEK